MKFRRGPGLGMDPVCDASDWHFFPGNACPHVLPKAFADVAMKFANTVGVTACPQRQIRHAESIRWTDAGLPKLEQVIEIDPEIVRETGKVTRHHLARERVIAGRNRRMRRENVRSCHDLKRGVIVQLLSLYVLTDPFQRKESRMAFVHMAHVGSNPKSIQYAHSTDP